MWYVLNDYASIPSRIKIELGHYVRKMKGLPIISTFLATLTLASYAACEVATIVKRGRRKFRRDFLQGNQQSSIEQEKRTYSPVELLVAAGGLKLILCATNRPSRVLKRHTSSIDVGALSPLQILAAGGLSRMAAQMILYPVDTLRTLAQTRTGAKTLADLGTGTLIRGCFVTSLFALPTGATQFLTNQQVKTYLEKKNESKIGVAQSSAIAINLKASIAAAFASLVVSI